MRDQEFEEYTLDKVEMSDAGAELGFDKCMGFFLPKAKLDAAGIAPKAGDTIRLYGRGFGAPVRGVDINGVTVYYETEEQYAERNAKEQAAKDDRERADYLAKGKGANDERITKLPVQFQKRIQRFREFSHGWGWRFEGYELFCCEQAVMFAEKLKTVEAVKQFHKWDYETQKQAIPEIDAAGHSGNTFGCACSLAHMYLSNPELLPQMHGALCPLVGCEEYGCWAAEKNSQPAEAV